MSRWGNEGIRLSVYQGVEIRISGDQDVRRIRLRWGLRRDKGDAGAETRNPKHEIRNPPRRPAVRCPLWDLRDWRDKFKMRMFE